MRPDHRAGLSPDIRDRRSSKPIGQKDLWEKWLRLCIDISRFGSRQSDLPFARMGDVFGCPKAKNGESAIAEPR